MSESPAYNPLLNGIPSASEWGATATKPPVPFQSHHQKLTQISTNGFPNSRQSSRDVSPLTAKPRRDPLTKIPASQLPPGLTSKPAPRAIPKQLTSNILLSQPQDSFNQNLLLASTYNPNSPSLVASSPHYGNSNVHIVGAPQTTSSFSNNRLHYSEQFQNRLFLTRDTKHTENSTIHSQKEYCDSTPLANHNVSTVNSSPNKFSSSNSQVGLPPPLNSPTLTSTVPNTSATISSNAPTAKHPAPPLQLDSYGQLPSSTRQNLDKTSQQSQSTSSLIDSQNVEHLQEPQNTAGRTGVLNNYFMGTNISPKHSDSTKFKDSFQNQLGRAQDRCSPNTILDNNTFSDNPAKRFDSNLLSSKEMPYSFLATAGDNLSLQRNNNSDSNITDFSIKPAESANSIQSSRQVEDESKTVIRLPQSQPNYYQSNTAPVQKQIPGVYKPPIVYIDQLNNPPSSNVSPPGRPPQYSQNSLPQLNQPPPPPPQQYSQNVYSHPPLGALGMPPMSYGITCTNRYPPQNPAMNQRCSATQPPPPANVNQQTPVTYSNAQYQPQLMSSNSRMQPTPSYHSLNQQFGNLNVTQSGFNRLWGNETFDLIQSRNILPAEKLEAPRVKLAQEALDAANCHPDIFRCTMTKIPESSALLNKSRLPLGVLIQPFRDLSHLAVIQCATIVRCRACRTYINPFVYFVDQKRWKCNICYRVNELPEEFQYDPVSNSYGDPSRRPEIKSSTIEYMAPQEYMLRPPQSSVYLFLLDVSSSAVESGYLKIVCNILLDELTNIPGDKRTRIGFLCYNSALHFYSMEEGLSQPHEMTVMDVDDVFLPSEVDTLMANLRDRKQIVRDLLNQLPNRFMNSHDNGSALGAALQAALKLMTPTGGRVSVFQCVLPNIGPGALASREDPTQRASNEVAHLNPATDFYKRLALDCSAHQVGVDLFILNSQYVDLSTLSGISRFSAGCIHHYPLFKSTRAIQVAQLESCFRRYLTRKLGLEAVMRIRCTRGLSIHTFHGNFFVRSTDLLSLPNCNPDAGFGMQVAIDENLSDLQSVCFQAALLYTSSKGERRIRVHTLCMPIASTLSDVLNSADQQCIVGLVAKMAVDRSFQSSLSDARDAFINVVMDVLSAYKLSLNQGSSGSASTLLAPGSLKLLPLYIVALLKYVAFRTGTSTRLDDRVYAMCQMKTLPTVQLIQHIYPDLYPIHYLTDEGGMPNENGQIIPQPPRLQLSAEKLSSQGAFLLDCGEHMIVYVGHTVSGDFLHTTLGFPHFAAIPDECFELARTGTPENERLHLFVNSLNDEKPYPATIQLIRDNSPLIKLFTERLIEDRIETALSYYEFLQHLKSHVK